MTYDDGFKAGLKDAQDGMKARASRTWKRAFLDGYSDGYFAGQNLKKVY
jgi:hypothetical protein